MLTDVQAPRPLRLRRTPALRDLFRETRLSPRQLVQPIFVEEGLAGRREVVGMPGVERIGLPALVDAAQGLVDAGVRSVLLFGIPKRKDPAGSGASQRDGIVQSAVRVLKRQAPELVVMTDVCLCEYTDHGHCRVLDGARFREEDTRTLLGRIAASHAEAGADVVAPSAMMDLQVAAIRRALAQAGHDGVAVLSYAAKTASAFYGPFRAAAESAPRFGNRQSYQLDPANAREALREIHLDVEEGADMVMVKPALPCLDLIRASRERFDVPLGAYQVSGEYSMIKAAAAQGWLDEREVARETLLSIRRAGADFIITYFAQQAAQLLREE